jgi:hypothetical protein
LSYSNSYSGTSGVWATFRVSMTSPSIYRDQAERCRRLASFCRKTREFARLTVNNVGESGTSQQGSTVFARFARAHFVSECGSVRRIYNRGRAEARRFCPPIATTAAL